jgi:hypothetical protein
MFKEREAQLVVIRVNKDSLPGSLFKTTQPDRDGKVQVLGFKQGGITGFVIDGQEEIDPEATYEVKTTDENGRLHLQEKIPGKQN